MPTVIHAVAIDFEHGSVCVHIDFLTTHVQPAERGGGAMMSVVGLSFC